MNRHRRLNSARHWLGTQIGRTPLQIAKSYRKRFGVDWPCAIHELSMLGIRFESAWVACLQSSLEGHQRTRRARREQLKSEIGSDFGDSDEYFAYITGYTPGGAPFGITWEEWRQIEGADNKDAQPECPF